MSIHKKLIAVQAQVSHVEKNTKGYNYKYEDLNAIISLIHPHLVAQKLGVKHEVVHTLECDTYECVTTVFDEEGEHIAIASPIIGVENLLAKGNLMQGMGSAITYARRYNLKNLFNLFSSDDDGKSLEPPKTQKNYSSAGADRPATTKQVQLMHILVKELDKRPDVFNKEAFYKWLGSESLSSMTDAKARQVITALKEKAEKIK